ncbi:MAG: lipase family protein [Methylovirgula sp.]
MSPIARPSLETSEISDVLNDAAIAALVNGIYAYPGYPKIAWDHFEQPKQDDGICWGLKRVGGSGLASGIDVVVLRGSVTQQDWFRDFDALADPFESGEARLAAVLHHLGFPIEGAAEDHAFLGPVHPGFLAGMEEAWAAMRPLLRENVIIAGHSLGAARAAILTGLMVHHANLHKGPAPLACITFGQPRPGFALLAKYIADVPQRSYCNGNGSLVDMITEVPIALGPEDYVHPHPLTNVCEEPGPSWKQQWGIFAWHAMPLYLRALERRNGLAPSGPDDVALMPDSAAPQLEIH